MEYCGWYTPIRKRQISKRRPSFWRYINRSYQFSVLSKTQRPTFVLEEINRVLVRESPHVLRYWPVTYYKCYRSLIESNMSEVVFVFVNLSRHTLSSITHPPPFEIRLYMFFFECIPFFLSYISDANYLPLILFTV